MAGHVTKHPFLPLRPHNFKPSGRARVGRKMEGRCSDLIGSKGPGAGRIRAKKCGASKRYCGSGDGSIGQQRSCKIICESVQWVRESLVLWYQCQLFSAQDSPA
jgi:hypothetical protein